MYWRLELVALLATDFEHIFYHFVHFVDSLDIELDGFYILFGTSFFDKSYFVFELHHRQWGLEFVGYAYKELLLIFDEGLDAIDEHIDRLPERLKLFGEIFEFDGFEHIFVHRGELFGQIGDIACQIIGQNRCIKDDEQKGQDIGKYDDAIELGHQLVQRGDIFGDFQKALFLEIIRVVEHHIGSMAFRVFVGDESDIVDIWWLFLDLDGDIECFFQKRAVDLLARMVVFGCSLDILGLFDELVFDLLVYRGGDGFVDDKGEKSD